MLTESVLVKSVDVRLKKNGGEFLTPDIKNCYRPSKLLIFTSDV